MATTSLPPSVARLRDAVSVDRNIDAPLYSTRRRLGVLAFVLLGAALLGVSLSVTPGAVSYTHLTLPTIYSV